MLIDMKFEYQHSIFVLPVDSGSKMQSILGHWSAQSVLTMHIQISHK